MWLAEDKLTGIQVAIKIYAPGLGLDDAGISLFTKEFSLVFDMNHTNLLHPTYYNCWERMPYLILPFCKNGSAFKYLKEENQITEEEAWNLFHDVAAGLAYLHAKTPPVIHQDIKPDNILISDENHYMITDFGISARIRSTLRRNKGEEMSGGTLAYMGPERFSQSPAPIMASDIWSLGATMYELLTGNTPFGDHGGVLQKSGADIPIIEAEYSDELKELVYKCLALNTWDRPMAKQIVDCASEHINGIEETESKTQEHINIPANKTSESRAHTKSAEQRKEHNIEKIKMSKKNLIIIGIIVVVCAVISFVAFLSGGSEPEPLPEPIVEEIDYDALCKLIIEEGLEEEKHGDEYRFLNDIDTISGKGYEDYYINALNKYSQIENYKDSISVSVYRDARERITKTRAILDSAYIAMKDMANKMRQWEQDVEANAFEMRANKIGIYTGTRDEEGE